VLAFITDAEVVVRILDHLGLPSTPPLAPAGVPPESGQLGFQSGPDDAYFIAPPPATNSSNQAASTVTPGSASRLRKPFG
jgi:hypothetical protein